MKFLFRAWNGECLPVALRVQAEGNETQVYIEEKSCKTVGDGLVRKAVELGRAIQWADIVVYESNFKTLADEAEKVSAVRPIIGSSGLAGRLEDDRGFAEEFAKKAGLTIPEDWKQFDGPSAWQAAQRFVEGQDEDEIWVWKPNGDSPASTYVSNDTAELVRMFSYWRTLYIKHNMPVSFILTPKIESTVEVSTEGWWDGTKFSHCNSTLERNKLCAGDVGEKTGCAGNVVWGAGPESKLYKSVVEPLGKHLGNKYRGPIDVNVMIRKEDNVPVFLEFTPRLGYDAIFGFMELCEKDFAKILSDTALGQLGGEPFGDPDKFAGAYRLTVPPYPEDAGKKDETKAVGVPVFGVNASKYDRHIHLVETRLSKQDELETSGPSGYVMVVSDQGDSPEAAMQAAYKRGKAVTIPNARWRCDLDTTIQGVYDRLTEAGWAGADQNLRNRFGYLVVR